MGILTGGSVKREALKDGYAKKGTAIGGRAKLEALKDRYDTSLSVYEVVIVKTGAWSKDQFIKFNSALKTLNFKDLRFGDKAVSFYEVLERTDWIKGLPLKYSKFMSLGNLGDAEFYNDLNTLWETQFNHGLRFPRMCGRDDWAKEYIMKEMKSKSVGNGIHHMQCICLVPKNVNGRISLSGKSVTVYIRKTPKSAFKKYGY